MTAVGIELDLYLEIQSAFAEDKECEHAQHSEERAFHGGKAEWYGQTECPKCGSTSKGVRALCDKWVQEIQSGALIRCINGTTPCGKISNNWTFTVLERIN